MHVPHALICYVGQHLQTPIVKLQSLLLPTSYFASGKRPQPRLPLELCEIIIDYSFADLPTLQACCLTCRGWVTSARIHIFRRVSLSTTKLHTVSSLLMTSPAIASYVKHLTIQFIGCESIADIREPLKCICSQMVAVQTLKLTGVSVYASLELSLLHNALPKSVTHLELGTMTVAPQSPLPALISSFPLLRGLSLGDGLSGAYESGAWEVASREAPRLRAPLETLHLSLAFSNPAVQSYVLWLASDANTLHLRSLSVTFDYPGTRINSPALLGLLVEKLGAPLETLELAMARDTDLSVIPFNLEQAVRLAHLRLVVRFSGSWTRQPHYIRNWVVTLLTRVHLPSIRTIHLCIDEPGKEDHLFLDWVDELVQAMSKSDLGALQRFTFECVGPVRGRQTAASLQSRLCALLDVCDVQLTAVKTSHSFDTELMTAFNFPYCEDCKA